MIMSEEKLLEALRICATNDKDKCTKCPYKGWCKADPINPHMNMPTDALEVINRQKSLIWAAQVTLRNMHKQLSKAKHDMERYGRRIRKQNDEILDLLAKLDGAIAGQETLQKALARAEKCVSCGDVIPEGRQVCPNCLDAKGEEK